MTGAAIAAPASAGKRSLDAVIAEVSRDFARAAWREAQHRCDAFLASDPEAVAIWYLRAAAAVQSGDLAAGCDAALAAHRLDPDCEAVATLLAIIHAAAGQLGAAAYYHKLARRAPPSTLASLLPAGFPTFDDAIAAIGERPLVSRAVLNLALDKPGSAVSLLRQHLYFAPDDAEAALVLAGIQLAEGEACAAAAGLRAALHVRTDEARLSSLLGKVLTVLGLFAEGRALHRAACAGSPDDARIHADAALDLLADPDIQPDVARSAIVSWGRGFRHASPAGRRGTPQLGKERPHIIGVLVAAQGSSPAGHALAEALACREPGRHVLVGFGCGQLSAPANLPFQKCMDRWQDIAADDPLTLAAVVRGEQVDVLIDASGFASPHLLTAFHSRMAPLQLGWLNLPYVPELGCLDAVLTDGYVDPPEPDGDGPARLYRLDTGCVLVQPGDALAGGTACDPPLTGGGLRFAADAELQELHPATVALWSEILHKTPGAGLILRDRGFSEPDVLSRLVATFGSFGTSHRVDIVRAADAAAFFASADIALVAGPNPRPEAVAAILAAKVPLVCPTGGARPRRFAASLLDHAGLGPACVAESPAAYVSLATRWAAQPDLRAAFRRDLADAHRWLPSPARRMRALEAAIEDLWRRTATAGAAGRSEA